jgi:hypothetical protein
VGWNCATPAGAAAMNPSRANALSDELRKVVRKSFMVLPICQQTAAVVGTRQTNSAMSANSAARRREQAEKPRK